MWAKLDQFCDPDDMNQNELEPKKVPRIRVTVNKVKVDKYHRILMVLGRGWGGGWGVDGAREGWPSRRSQDTHCPGKVRWWRRWKKDGSVGSLRMAYGPGKGWRMDQGKAGSVGSLRILTFLGRGGEWIKGSWTSGSPQDGHGPGKVRVVEVGWVKERLD